jgi:hypothetical protein
LIRRACRRALRLLFLMLQAKQQLVMGADVMSTKHRRNRDGSQQEPHQVNPFTPASVGPSRAALLASASLIALAALCAPGAARAACAPSPQTISGPVAGPVDSNGGAITVTGSGKIAGDPDGVDAVKCAITKLTIKPGGTISGGNGAFGAKQGGAGALGVSNADTITTLTNSGAISGGAGGSGGKTGGAGGAGIGNSGAITTSPTSARSAAEAAAPARALRPSTARAARVCRTRARS